jgi:hypothetical protein
MFNPELILDSTDDSRFVDLAIGLIAGAVVTYQPPEVYIIKINNWFDHKWLGFSGKFLGAAGSWRRRLTIPPFVANRIIDQWHYSHDDASDIYRFKGSGNNLHHRGPAAENLRRAIKKIVPAAALFWYSSDTGVTGGGSLMAYVPIEDDHWSWFVSFRRDG